MRERFREEIEKGASGSGNPDEVQRNRDFLALQNMLPVALQRTQAKETGKNALIRFAAVTEEVVELSD
nr:triacylglycerol lipase [Yersinia frederiksenii]